MIVASAGPDARAAGEAGATGRRGGGSLARGSLARGSLAPQRSAGRLGRRASHLVLRHLAPLPVGLRGRPQQQQVTEQHDGRRHDYPPGRHPGTVQRARRDAEREEHQQQAPPRGHHPPAGPVIRCLTVLIRAGNRHGNRDGNLGNSGNRAPLRTPSTGRRRNRGRGLWLFFRARIHHGLLLGLRSRRRRGSRRVAPEPTGDEHARPDGDDRDVQDRAAQPSSLAEPRQRAHRSRQSVLT